MTGAGRNPILLLNAPTLELVRPLSPHPADSAPASPLNHGYLIQNPKALALLRLIDALPWPGARPPREQRGQGAGPAPRRILLADWAHLGDCVIATATLDLVRRLWPEAEIGLLVASWSAPIFRHDPRLRWLHVVDHWKINRASLSRGAKIRRYLAMRRAALAEMRRIGYDAALDLYPFFPPAGPLFRAAGIPVRIGYESGGFRRFLTHRRPWRPGGHMAQAQAALVEDLRPEPAALARGLADLRPRLADPAAASPVAPGSVIVHMGAGAPAKEWSADKWRALVAGLTAHGLNVVLTGRGAREARLCADIAGAVAGVDDRCDKLDWEQLVAAVGGARLVIGVDSLAGHIAAARGTPVLTLWSGINDPAQWRPLGARARVLHTAPSCLPCHRPGGCAGMACLQGLSVESVLAAALELAAPPTHDREAPGGASAVEAATNSGY